MTNPPADSLTTRIAGLERRLKDLLREHAEMSRGFHTRKSQTEEALRTVDETCRAEHEARGKELAAESERIRGEIEERHQADLDRIERAWLNASKRADRNLSAELKKIDEMKEKAAARSVNELKRTHPDLLMDPAAVLAGIERLRDEAKTIGGKISVVAKSLKVRLRRHLPSLESTERISSRRLLRMVEKRHAGIEQRLAEHQQGFWFRFARSCPRLPLLLLLIVILHGAGLFLLRQWTPDDFDTILTMIAPVTFLGFVTVAVLFRNWMRGRARLLIDPLHEALGDTESLLLQHEESLREETVENRDEFERRKGDRVREIQQEFRPQEKEREKLGDIRRNILSDHKTVLVEKAKRRKKEWLAREDERRKQAERALEDRLSEDVRSRRQKHADQRVETSGRAEEEEKKLAARWDESIRNFRQEAEEQTRASRERRPKWNGYRMPHDFPRGVNLGDVRFDVGARIKPPDKELPFSAPDGISLPLDLAFPGRGNLIIDTDPATRDAALQGLFGTVLRVLASFPPAKARFTILDPVGLGQNFSALMHLADYDESLVGGRIWTETVHMERKLAELTEHIEKVIQKYLRNRYNSIDEYNQEVAQMAEAYRFLIIADFPTGFSDLALERLDSILKSGPRCGVYTLLLGDAKKLAADGLVVEATPDGFRTEGGMLTIEPPPPSEALTDLLHGIGKECAEAGRVELDFEVIAPKKDLWTESAEAGVRIPLGRAGADRLQYLELGKGTKQHALVAGKTGSGKSTLFHVLITNAALWYSPEELELYLIDFKKGVEFKTYATHGLPHGRVVAIESDREFGLSVLRRIDRELAGRAENFRQKGVQEFAGYRKIDKSFPRTLLLIDEFQEFFTEEDAIAQEAALLLDRIVRQGRAFGIHVILGSQTLGGSYTLARTTLGQMAVRIALQCNEADSYLILNDENSAARLLGRPGEAIYNDMSGMVEGNNPFQISWLPDEVRDRFLGRVREQKAPDREPMTVFEGNVPADIRNNPNLRERLAKPFQNDEAEVAWVGEPNAIKGPTEVRFRNQGGSNLLIIGQQRESAHSIITTTMISLAAAAPKAGIRFVILDGTPAELAHGARLSELAKLLPHPVELVEFSDIPKVMEELDAEVAGRLDGSRKADTRIVVIVHDLQQFRKLRQKDEFDYGGGEEKKTADKCYANVLTEGPAQKVHSIIWCDSLVNLNRTFNRKTLREFQIRILFQMSATDSSELIDTPAAGKLGLYRGLLFHEEQGSVEKFRPYAVPDAETVEWIRSSLAGG